MKKNDAFHNIVLLQSKLIKFQVPRHLLVLILKG